MFVLSFSVVFGVSVAYACGYFQAWLDILLRSTFSTLKIQCIFRLFCVDQLTIELVLVCPCNCKFAFLGFMLRRILSIWPDDDLEPEIESCSLGCCIFATRSMFFNMYLFGLVGVSTLDNQ
jgi:hypothetical protein